MKKIMAPMKILGRAIWSTITLLKRLFPASHYALLSLLYIVGLEMIFALQRWVVVVVLTVLIVVAIGVILVRLEEKNKFSLSNALLPILATTGLSGFTFSLPNSIVLHIYIVAAGWVFFFLLKHGARQAYPIWNWIISLLIYFLNIAVVTGLHFYLYMPVIVVLIAVFIITGLMAWQALRRIASGAEIIIPVLAMSFVLTEVSWALLFLPIDYLIVSGIMVSLYYSIFNLLSLSIIRQLSRREIYEYVGVSVLAMMIILINARWV